MVDRKKLNISLKRRVDTRLWNPKKQRVKGISEIRSVYGTIVYPQRSMFD
ncbi:hypothetical protein [Ulvibacterium marinum]